MVTRREFLKRSAVAAAIPAPSAEGVEKIKKDSLSLKRETDPMSSLSSLTSCVGTPLGH